MTNETKKQLKLLAISLSALVACISSYILFFLVSWKLLLGVFLSHLSVMLYGKLIAELQKNQDESGTPAIHDDIEKDW